MDNKSSKKITHKKVKGNKDKSIIQSKLPDWLEQPDCFHWTANCLSLGHRLGSASDDSFHVSTNTPEIRVYERRLYSTVVVGDKILVTVDETLPITNLQIRMPDGSRMVTKLNHSHTVANVRQHITQNRPNFSNYNFVLMTTFPKREITDESSTLKDANLINTVLVVHMK